MGGIKVVIFDQYLMPQAFREKEVQTGGEAKVKNGEPRSETPD